MGTADAALLAVASLWLGMVLAISFVEAPLKFRAPGLTIPVGLAIGRLVFRALHVVETLLAIVVVLLLVLGAPSTGTALAMVLAILVLGVQLLVIQPWLGRRSDAVLSGEDSGEGGRSRAHLVFVAAEVLKVVALVRAVVGLVLG